MKDADLDVLRLVVAHAGVENEHRAVFYERLIAVGLRELGAERFRACVDDLLKKKETP